MNNLYTVKQRTLSEAFSLSGKGLHTGLNVTITFRPANENAGYQIRRIDLPGHPIIQASAENVVSTDRGTVLSVDGIQVGTLEHGLPALYANEVDNCLIDVDAPEFPILEGSAIEYVKKIAQAGIEEQAADREYFIPCEKIEYMDEASGSHLILLPDDKFSIRTKIDFNSIVLGTQNAMLDNLSDFGTQFSMCRTFVFVREIEALLQRGLIKGGDLNNAIVIYDEPIQQKELDYLADIMNVERKDAEKMGYILSTPLRFANEPARHKLLDIIGDISLVGRFIKGTIIAVYPGHKVNNQFARAILKEIKNQHNTNEAYCGQLQYVHQY
jgi:UDP-3-O-[3-hydroxymyristoyl] N-acetylglucosamine deacetylase/3-hydroxyacyl-[acyl-carrier-protein] dehydratase